MNNSKKKGGLIKKTKEDDQVFALLLSGVSYVTKATAKKYDPKLLIKINEGGHWPSGLPKVEKMIVIKDEKNP